jgi:GDPmannose 4,6-dehydratase
VIATGRTHSVAEFAAAALARVGITDWERWVETDAQFIRPVDASELVGDASKAQRELDWQPSIDFAELVGVMVDHDLALITATR